MRGFDSHPNLFDSMATNTGNYLEKPPEGVDKGVDEWRELSYDTQYYHANKDRQEYIRERAQERKDEIKEIFDKEKRSEGCSQCEESEPCALDYHHLGDDKYIEVANMLRLGYSEEKVREEVEKCVLLCANCHRKYHHGVIEL